MANQFFHSFKQRLPRKEETLPTVLRILWRFTRFLCAQASAQSSYRCPVDNHGKGQSFLPDLCGRRLLLRDDIIALF